MNLLGDKKCAEIIRLAREEGRKKGKLDARAGRIKSFNGFSYKHYNRCRKPYYNAYVEGYKQGYREEKKTQK